MNITPAPQNAPAGQPLTPNTDVEQAVKGQVEAETRRL